MGRGALRRRGGHRVELRGRRRSAHRSRRAARALAAHLHARHRPAAPRDVRSDGGRAAPLRCAHRGVLSRARARRSAAAREGILLVSPVDRCAQGVLLHPQGRAARPRARGPRRVGHRATPRAVGHAHPGRGARARRGPRRHRQAEPARCVDRSGGLGLRAQAPPADQRAARARLPVDRLRALHPRRGAGRRRARGPLVVGVA